ncbi:MAG: 6-phosphogluconolactonase [Gaiellaceae bacterium]|nr:6-phosphogluconolactonase [Gaiellaceae bacterium]
MTRDVELVVVDGAEEAARRTAELLATAARSGGHIALSGGSGPERAYELAAELEPDWSRVEVWWGDDRCVPPDDELSNYRMAKEALLDRLAVPPAAVHRIEGELDPAEAADRYDRALQGVRLDLNLLGIGPDGHTASLFPDASTLDVRDRLAVAAEPGLEPFVPRVTLTVPANSAAAHVLFVVTGAAKADAARRAFGGPPDPGTPASLVRSESGHTTAILDREAASELSI